MIDNLEKPLIEGKYKNTINIDGKIYTETQIKKFLTERILLQKEVEFLRTELQRIANRIGSTDTKLLQEV